MARGGILEVYVSRATCYECRKAATECICPSVVRVDNRVGVHVLQHPREKWHAIGTARIVGLGLARATVEAPYPTLLASAAFRDGVPPGAALLFPHATARDLPSIPAAEHPQHLVILDGTWSQARALFRENPWMASLQFVRLTPEQPSQYRIRKEPAVDYVSTVEAVVAALKILEPETPGLDGLLGTFNAMIDRQITHIAKCAGRWRERKRSRPRAPRPDAPNLLADLERVVLIYAELISFESPEGRIPEVVCWAAERPATGETFYKLMRPVGGELQPHHMGYMGLSEADFASCNSAAEVASDWERFIRPDDIVAAWSPSTLRHCDRIAPLTGKRAFLKSMYANLSNTRPGRLEEVMAALGAPLPAPNFPGRAGLRLAQTRAVLDHIRAAMPAAADAAGAR